MSKTKKSTRRWWNEGKAHIEGKNIIRQAARLAGASCVEEERFPVDLHDVYPELWPKKSMRGYQADLLITKKTGKTVYQVIAEVDGEYHTDDPKQQEKDTIRNLAIPAKYGLQVVRFDKEALLKGRYSNEQIIAMLGLY